MSLVPYKSPNTLANRFRNAGLAGITSYAMARYISSRRMGQRRRRGTYASFKNRSRKRIGTNMRFRTSGVGVTTQHDQRRVYRKKTMPRFKKRRWRRFVKKVNAASEKDLGSRTVVFSLQRQFSNSTDGQQVGFALCLYPQRSSTNYLNDLSNISQYENPVTMTQALGNTVWNSSKFLFQSAVMDITFRNSSTIAVEEGMGVVNVPDASAKLEVDVYEISMNRTAEEVSGGYINTFESVLGNNVGQTEPIGGSGTEIAYFLRGITPWELSYSLSRFGLKIWKKTKYFVNNNDTFTYQVRDPRRYSIMQEDLERSGGFNRRKMTRIIYVVAKLVPGLPIGVNAGEYTTALTVGCTRKYLYKIEGITDDRTIYLSQT